MQTDRSLGGRQKIDLSLRLWSDRVSIAALLKGSGFEVEHCHCLGEPIVVGGRLTNRVARRHYASLQNLKTGDPELVSRWLVNIQEMVEKTSAISLGLKSGQIEGLIWIALFGDEAQSFPYVDPVLITKFLAWRLEVLCENYADIDANGLPRKVWLTR